MAALAVIAGLIRGFTGFGSGLVLVPLLGLLLGPQVAVPLVVTLDAVVALQLVPPAVKLVRWRTILPVGLAATLTIPAGSLVLAGMDPRLLQRMMSFVVLALVGALAGGWRYAGHPSPGLAALVGAASGLLTGSGGIGGPPVILFFLSGPQTAPQTRASFLCYFAITQLVALAAFAAAGLFTTRVIAGAAILAPFFLLAAWAGTRLFDRANEARFRRTVLAFLALVALAGLFL